jgi:hypothetical protein
MRTLYILTAARNRMNYRPDIFVAVCVSRGMQESDAQQLFDALRESHIKG